MAEYGGNGMEQEAALYIVATPIGNMKDITLRALETLGGVDFIACEDTRVTQKLLLHYGIKTKTICYNDHSGVKERERIIKILEAGQSVALVSDAGTPLISDPGYRLVREVSAKDIRVIPLPGASSVMAALCISGLATDRFYFSGFLPPKTESRKNALRELKDFKASLVFFESARRLCPALVDIGEVFPGREVAVMRELTKKFEQARRGCAEELLHYYTGNPPKGEIVIIISPPAESSLTSDEIKAQLANCLDKMSVKDAVSLVAENTGAHKKEVYKLALEMHK